MKLLLEHGGTILIFGGDEIRGKIIRGRCDECVSCEGYGFLQ